MRYLVTMDIPQPAYSFIDALQRAAQPPSWHRTIGPHITILAPDLPLQSSDEAVISFKNLPLDAKGFVVAASRLSCFERSGRTTLILAAQSVEAFQPLFQILVRRAVWQATTVSTRRPYVPRITLASGLTKPAPITLQRHISGSFEPIKFRAQSLTLYNKTPDSSSWQVLATRKLI